LPSVFDLAEQLLATASTTVFARRFLVVPQRAGKVTAGGPDPGRPSYFVQAVLDHSADVARPSGPGSRRGSMVEAAMPTLKLHISLDALGANPVPIAGDQVTDVDMPGAPVYRVVTEEPSGTTFLEFPLVPLAQ